MKSTEAQLRAAARYRERHREIIRQKGRERQRRLYHTDPEFKERKQTAARERYRAIIKRRQMAEDENLDNQDDG